MPRLRSRIIAACVILAVGGGAVLAVFFGVVNPEGGPVVLEGDGYGACTTGSFTHGNVYGLAVVNHGGTPARLAELVPRRISNIVIKGVWVLGHPEDGGIGAVSYPVGNNPPWNSRRALKGFVLAPHTQLNIAIRLVLAPGQQVGEIDGGVLHYVSNGLPRQSTSDFVFGYAVHRSRCPRNT